MRWEDERYVRVYTRDTPEWTMLSWEARSVFLLLLRVIDRAGTLRLGKAGARGLAAMLRVPVDVVERALEELVADGCVVLRDGVLVVPNFVEAQESTQSDKARKRASRERARVEAMTAPPPVTNRDEPSQDVTESHEESQPVTAGHEESQSVTPCCAVPCLALSEGSAADATPLAAPAVPKTSPTNDTAPPTGDPWGLSPPEPTPPAAKSRPKPAKSKPPAEKPPTAVSEAWRLWLEAYEHRWGTPYWRGGADGKAMQQLVALAAEQGPDRGFEAPVLLEHWFRSYLADTSAYLLENKHPLRTLDRGLQAYGSPKVRDAPRALEPSPASTPLAWERPPPAAPKPDLATANAARGAVEALIGSFGVAR